jgi:peptide deformylase
METIKSLKIRLLGDPVLRKRASLVKKVTANQRDTLSKMARLMYAASGIGLAAPQIGVSESLIVVDAGQGLFKLINPRIIKREGEQSLVEGCLSVPDICIKIRRSESIVITALNDEGLPVKVEAVGLLACVFQHEIDHLHAKLIVDHASILEKIKMRKKLEALAKKAEDESFPGSKTKACELQL